MLDKRERVIETDTKYIKKLINRLAKEYQERGLGTIEGYKESILQKLIKDFRGIYWWKIN